MSRIIRVIIPSFLSVGSHSWHRCRGGWREALYLDTHFCHELFFWRPKTSRRLIFFICTSNMTALFIIFLFLSVDPYTDGNFLSRINYASKLVIAFLGTWHISTGIIPEIANAILVRWEREQSYPHQDICWVLFLVPYMTVEVASIIS